MRSWANWLSDLGKEWTATSKQHLPGQGPGLLTSYDLSVKLDIDNINLGAENHVTFRHCHLRGGEDCRTHHVDSNS
eukprot:7514980-Heterocapsa_arctica.AAC.1